MYMDSDENISSSPQNDKFLNELTMKLLTNKTNYAKYLSKTDNEKYEEHQEFMDFIKESIAKKLAEDLTTSTKYEITDKKIKAKLVVLNGNK